MKKLAFLLVSIFSLSAFAQLPAIPANEQELTKICNDAIQNARNLIDAAATNKNEPTFENTVLAVENALADMDAKAAMPLVLFYVSPSPMIRQAAAECRANIKKMSFDIYGRDDLFVRFQGIKNSNKGRKLIGEDKKLLDDNYETFILNGLGNPDLEKRKQIKQFANQVSEAELEFTNTLNNDKKFIQVSKAELVGMSDGWISSLEKAKNGKYIITTNYPDYIPFMENAKTENARKRLYEQFATRGGKRNVELLEKALVARSELAKLIGYGNHADKVLTVGGRMVTSVPQIRSFLDDLVEKLKPYLAKDMDEMKRLKCKETRCKDWDSVVINSWDVSYYINQMKKKVGNIDPQAVREYFPMETVTQGMFQIYQQLLSIDFDKLQNIPVWDPSVDVYAVRDRATHEVLGYFYLDMYPRDGKYGHAAVQGMIKSKYLGGSKYQKPVAAMMCNFAKSTADAPSLLDHDEVETYFHEFGHVMDNMLSHSKYYSHGNGDSIYSPRMVNRPIDFAEAPSQMLENWVWNAESLAMLSGHYKTGQKLPADLLKKMIELKNVANGYVNTRQLTQAILDLDFHTLPQPMDTTKYWRDKVDSMLGIKMLTSVYPQASFGHIMDGYDVGYYGYMWSKVYAEDMFSVFQKNGILNPRIGMMYRKQILEPASGQSPFVSLKNFLGREPNSDAFIKSLGIETAAEPATATGSTQPK